MASLFGTYVAPRLSHMTWTLGKVQWQIRRHPPGCGWILVCSASHTSLCRSGFVNGFPLRIGIGRAEAKEWVAAHVV